MLQPTLQVGNGKRETGGPFAARAVRCEPAAPGGQCDQCHTLLTLPPTQFLAPSLWVLFPAATWSRLQQSPEPPRQRPDNRVLGGVAGGRTCG